MTSRRLAAPVSALALALGACGSDAPITFSQPVGISLSFGSGAVSQGKVSTEKNINTESGNPYGAFVNATRATIGEPARIVVAGLALQLLPTSTNVSAFQQVFAGTEPAVVVSFQMNGTDAVYPVGQVLAPTGVGPVPLAVVFDSATMAPADWASLRGGQFKVRLSGPAAAGFASANATANLQAWFTFVAFP